MQNDHVYLQPADLDRLAEMVLELAQQLHVERARRIALEKVLAEKAGITGEMIDACAATPQVRQEGRRQIDVSLERLMRIMAASGGPDAPLR